VKKSIRARLVTLDIETDDPRALPEILGSVLGELLGRQTTTVIAPLPRLEQPRQRRARTSEQK
jgi:hypothetical protein